MDPAAVLPAEGRSRETAIRRDASGRWWNGSDPITHPLLVRAFDSWIDRAEDGRYCLKNDINWAYVAIEDAPFFVESCRLDERGAELSLSDGRTERLDPSTLREGATGLYCDVRGGRFPARFEAHAAMQLGEAIESPDAGPPGLTTGVATGSSPGDSSGAASAARNDGARAASGEGGITVHLGSLRVKVPWVADPLAGR